MSRALPEKKRLLTRLGETLDQVLLSVAPGYGARRISTRRRFEVAQQQYEALRGRARGEPVSYWEGAETDDYRSKLWNKQILSPDSGLELDLNELRFRSRILYRDDSLGGAVDQKVNLVVGTGFTPQAKIRKEQWIGSEQAELLNIEAEDLYECFSECCDTTGTRSFWDVERLVCRHIDVDGEAFVRLSALRRGDCPIPLALEVIDPERVSTPPEQAGNPLVRMGVQYNSSGRVLGYYVQVAHPYDTKNLSLKFDFVPASQMLHIFDEWFAGQSRGVPWFSRVMTRIRDAKDLDEASLIAAQVEACFAAFVEVGDSDPYDTAKGNTTETVASRRLQDITPGRIEYLAKNQKVTFATPTRPGNSVGPLQEWNYRRISGGINFPYEMIMSDWRGLSFSGGRLVLTSAKKDVASRQKLLRNGLHSPVWRQMIREGVMFGEITADIRRFGEYPRMYTRHKWNAQVWDYSVNPVQDINASILEIDANIRTLSDVIAERTGGDLEETLALREKEIKLQKQKQILEAKRLVLQQQKETVTTGSAA